ncbi:hypothetical protein ScPMuIL_013566 [Solemya velum]
MVIKSFIDALAKKTLSNRNEKDLLEEQVLCGESPDQNRKLRHLKEVFALKNLPIMVDLWETCARLCLNSSVFVSHFQNSTCYLTAENTLIQILQQLCSDQQDCHEMDDSGQEGDTTLQFPTPSCLDVFFLKLSLMEAVLIVCSTCYGQIQQQGDNEESLWKKLRESFYLCSDMRPCRLRALFDRLINASMPQRDTILQYSHTRNISLWSRDDEIEEDDDVRELLQLGSEDEQESLNTEPGYDADCESISDDSKLEHHLMSLNSSDLIMRRTYFPSVFRLMIDLLAFCQKTSSGQSILQNVLIKLLQTLRIDRNAVKAMCSRGLLNVLLTGFWDLLLTDGTDNTARDLLLSLIQLMAQYQLSAIELQKILQLFHFSSISHDVLLSTLLSVVENSQVEPYHSLLYPVKKADRSEALPTFLNTSPQTWSFESSTDTSVSSLASTRQNQCLQDVWNLAALQIPLKDNLSWPPFQNGFSVFLWFKVMDRQSRGYSYRGLSSSRSIFNTSFDSLDTESSLHSSLRNGKQREACQYSVSECLHLFSVGTTEKLFEVWTDPCNGGILCRLLTSSLYENGPVLRELVWKEAVVVGKWNHLAVSYVESLDGSTVAGKTKMILNGCQSCELILDYPASHIRMNPKSQLGPYLCLGHVLDNLDDFVQGTWSFSSMMFCKGTKLEKEDCFHLYTLGPDCESISKCDCSEQKTNYAPCVTKQMVVHLKKQHDVIVGMRSVDLSNLRASLLLSYRAKTPNQISFYTTPVSSQLAELFGPQQSNNRVLLTQQPRVMSVSGHGLHQRDEYLSLEKAIQESGGIGAIIYLVAKVYEGCSGFSESNNNKLEQEKLQAKALELLFSVVHTTPQLSQEFINMNGPAMLNKILTSSKSVVNSHILKALFDASTTESLFRFDLETGKLILRRNTEAVVRDVTIIENVVLNWRMWGNSDIHAVVLLFLALEALVSERHPLQDFNIKQFHSVNLTNKIFLIYQERIQDGLPPLPSNISQSVVNIVQCMMGSPPDFHLIVAICDFLLLAHPAANSYINHSKTGFFFNSWWSMYEVGMTNGKEQTEASSYPLVHLATNQSIHSSQSPLTTNHSNQQDKNCELAVSGNIVSSEILEETILDPDGKDEVDNVIVPHANATLINDDSFFYPISKNEKNPFSDFHGDPALVKVSEYVESLPEPPKIDLEGKTNLPALYDGTESFFKLSDRFDHDQSDMTSKTEESALGERLQKKIGELDATEVTSSSTSYSTGSVSLSDMEYTGETKDNEPVHFDEVIEEEDRGLTVLFVGLLKLLTSVVGIMPDSMVEKSFRKVINPETFIVLAHSSSPEIRTAVIKVLETYLNRAKDHHVDSFQKMDSFHLLSTQLYQYPTHEKEVEAALSILLGRPFHFDEGLEIKIPDLSPIQEMSLILTLAMLENSLSDMALSHNILTLLTKMFEASVTLAILMLEAGLVEVLCNMIARIYKQDAQNTDLHGVEEYQLILEDIQQFLCIVAVKEFSTSGNVFYQQFEDLLLLLRHLEQKIEFEQGAQSKRVQTLKTIQFNIILRVLEVVGKASEDFSKQSGWFLRLTPSRTSIVLYENDDKPFPFLDLSFEGKKQKSKSSYTDSTSSSMEGSSDLDQSKPASRFPFSVFSLGRKKRFSMLPVSQSELTDRFKKVLPFAVDLIIYTDKTEVVLPGEEKLSLFSPEPQNVDRTFQRRLFDWTFRAFEMTLTSDRLFHKNNKNIVMWAVRDVTRLQFSRQLVNLLSSNQDYGQRTYALQYIMNEVQGKTILKVALEISSDLGRELSYLVYDLLHKWQPRLNSQHREDGSHLINMLRQLGDTEFFPLTCPSEKNFIENKHRKEKVDWMKKKSTSIERVLQRFAKLSNQIATHAMEVTQNVTKSQNTERQKFFDHIKRSMTEKIQIKKTWQELVQNLTHERAVWFCPESYPRFWQLDPTEGPCRIRKRLQRSHWGTINNKKKDAGLTEEEMRQKEKKFLDEGFQYKLDSKHKDPPLIYLFEDDHLVSDSAALIYNLYRNEKIHHTCRCFAISPNSESQGELLVGENCVFFVADEAITDANYTQVLIGNKDQLSMTWPYHDIREIHKRWYQLRDIGIEIFLTNGKTCLLAFATPQERDYLNQYVRAMDLPNLIETENLSAIQQLWLEGKITNFEYLTHLNKMSGRSFNDLMQYPVFPFILRDYTGKSLNLKDPDIYRDLSKPIAVQNKSREAHYKENYEALKKEMDHPVPMLGDSALLMGPFHYGSHYSNSGTVLHFLVRMPPFTEMFLQYQSYGYEGLLFLTIVAIGVPELWSLIFCYNCFDLPNRSFHSIATSWKLSSYQSTSDVKELLPEFFFFPEFLRNSEGWNMGRRDDGDIVWDVKLPPWCKGDPRLFVLIYRQALESDHVTQNLQNWIDLVFGYKQQDEAAVKSINVFHPATYFGIDVYSIEEPVKRKAMETMVKTYGQTPKQLFRTPQSQSVAIATRLSQLNLFQPGSTPIINSPSPISTVMGVKWGQYVGSADLPQPTITWKNTYSAIVSSLVALPTGEVFGIGANSCFLVMYSKERAPTGVNSTDVVWAAILTWGHSDGILRIINQRDKPTINFLHHSPFDKVTCCASVPDCRLLFTGGTGGLITVYHTVFNQAKESDIQLLGQRKCLFGHSDTINAIVVNKAYSILVSASKDRTCIIWDLNRLSYVRSICSHNNGVEILAISDTLGDIATVSHQGLGSCLQLHTINAQLVASYNCEDTINALAFSSAPEGSSVNVIAGGLSSGVVRLWSTWDLCHIRDFRHDSLLAKPVVSLTFTHDSQRLFISLIDGTVTLWEVPSSGKQKPPRFISFLRS